MLGHGESHNGRAGCNVMIEDCISVPIMMDRLWALAYCVRLWAHRREDKPARAVVAAAVIMDHGHGPVSISRFVERATKQRLTVPRFFQKTNFHNDTVAVKTFIDYNHLLVVSFILPRSSKSCLLRRRDSIEKSTVACACRQLSMRR